MLPSSPSPVDEPSGDGCPDHDEGENVRCVLQALHDEDCRAILRSVSERPKTATELSEACDVPLSTTYRKLDVLTRSRLLREGPRVETGGKHAMQYELHVVDVHVSITEEGAVEVALPAEGAVDAP